MTHLTFHTQFIEKYLVTYCAKKINVIAIGSSRIKYIIGALFCEAHTEEQC